MQNKSNNAKPNDRVITPEFMAQLIVALELLGVTFSQTTDDFVVIPTAALSEDCNFSDVVPPCLKCRIRELRQEAPTRPSSPAGPQESVVADIAAIEAQDDDSSGATAPVLTNAVDAGATIPVLTAPVQTNAVAAGPTAPVQTNAVAAGTTAPVQTNAVAAGPTAPVQTNAVAVQTSAIAAGATALQTNAPATGPSTSAAFPPPAPNALLANPEAWYIVTVGRE
ncbi:hypothetical protein H0H92_014966, partial [Tricholoma furcatifolium]